MKKIYLILITTLLWVTGCSQKGVETSALMKAKAAYEKEKENIALNAAAPMELFSASKIYNASKEAGSEAEADHFAYMLNTQLSIAKETAHSETLKNEISALKENRTKALLDEREKELLLMQKEAQKARLEAQMTQEKLMALQELNAQMTNRGLVLTLGDVLFATAKADLLPGSVRAIEKLSEFLIDNPEREVLIEGHTDNIGSSTYNLDLSLRRATAVQEALVAKGIESTRLFIKGYGEMYPVASNDDVGGRQQNRRVEIVILEEGVTPESMSRENQSN